MGSHFHYSDLNCVDASRLDLEFRQILCIIKDYIPYVNSNYMVSFYRAWLEKLSSICCDKSLRNVYLLELARQIKDNVILPPFDQQPPSGSLESFQNFYLCDDNISVENGTNKLTPSMLHRQHKLSHTVSSYNQNSCPSYEFNNSLKNKGHFTSPEESYPELDSKPIDNYCIQPINEKEKPSNYLAINKLQAKVKKRKSKNCIKLNDGTFMKNNSVRDFPKNDEEPRREMDIGPVKRGNIQEDSSWCDLTDSSVTSIILNPLGSGDAEKRMGLQYCKFNSIRRNPSKVETCSESSQSPVSYQLCEIKRDNDQIQEIKYPLKDTHFIADDWKKTIEALQLRLTETLNQNNELKSIVDTLTSKLKSETLNREQNECIQKKFLESHSKEMEALKKNQAENIKNMEESFQLKFDESAKLYNQRLEEIEESYRKKMKELKSVYENVIKEKDKEICRLSETIQHQCTRMSNEIAALRNQMENLPCNHNDEEKIFVLQKCVSKMDKLFHKSEKEYMKQITKLKQELEMKEKITEIQLKTQRAELIAGNSADKQRQFEEEVNSLEVKYIKMLEYHESEVMESKRQDEEQMRYLKDLLDNHDIAYIIT